MYVAHFWLVEVVEVFAVVPLGVSFLLSVVSGRGILCGNSEHWDAGKCFDGALG